MKKLSTKTKKRTVTVKDTQIEEFETRDLGPDIRASGVTPMVIRSKQQPTSILLEPELVEQLRARGEKTGYRNGYENGTLKTGEGVLHVKVPQIRGWTEPYRSQLWGNVGNTSDVLKKLIVEMYVGGMSQRDIEYGLEQAVGQFVLSKSTVSEIAQTLTDEYEAFRTRDLRQEPVAYLFIDTVYEPLRRWGQKTGVLCVWAICEDGRKVLLSLSTTNSESYESCREVLRDLGKRGMQPPVTIPTDGALGLTQAIDAMWPKSLRIRCWFHKDFETKPQGDFSKYLLFQEIS